MSLDRREFVKRTSAAAGGLVTGGFLLSGRSAGQDRDMSDNRLVLLGLNALARAHELDYFADGHRGAAMVAAHLLCVENDLSERARRRIVELVDLNWASTPLCKPFPDTTPDPARVAEIGKALVEGGEVLRQVGHNAIFAMLSIKAFRMLPSAATPERIDGVCKLIRSFTPWRDVEPDEDIDPPPFADAAAASRFVLQEASAAIDRFIGFGQGFAGHMLTFGQSLVELAAMGDVQWAESCRTAFRKYVTVTRRGPGPDDKRYPDHQPTESRPTDAEYWENRSNRAVDIGHVFKYPYSYYNLLGRAGDSDLSRTLDAKAYHLF
ncbi:MAG: twin-arginine translocation signal domain-containing protein [Planctomycetaceae bacterium]|nr:twin-arginine translocation signal domain-containing protein [Planctomycetaceae bacterium]